MNFKSIFILGMTVFTANAFATVGYHTGQQTQTAAERWKTLLPGTQNLSDTLYLSSPPFNKAKTPEQTTAWETIKATSIDRPSFGDAAKNAANCVAQSGEKVEWGVDSFVLGKLPKTAPLIKELESRDLFQIAARIQTFINDLGKRKIKSLEEWEEFLKSHNLPVAMELDFNLYLKNFDFDGELTPETLEEINNKGIADKDGKTVSIKEECIRWLAKVDFRPMGCFTDVTNLMEINPQELPSILMMDAEGDDKGVLSILNRRHAEQGTKLQVIVQLPTDERADPIANHYSELGYEVFRDPESQNMPALLRTWSELMKLEAIQTSWSGYAENY